MEDSAVGNAGDSQFDWWSKAAPGLRIARHTVAILFWFYVITKLFVFDSDAFVVATIDKSFLWILDYKFILLLSAIALTLIVTKNVKIAFWVAYVFGYPFLILGRATFYFVAWIAGKKSWNLALFVVNVLFAIYRGFKTYFVVIVGAVLSAVVVSASSSAPILIGALTSFVLLNCILFWRAFSSAFKKTGVFELHSQVATYAVDSLKKPMAVQMEAKPLVLQSYGEEDRKTITTRLEQALMLHEGCRFWASVLRNYKGSGLHVVLYVSNFAVLFVMTVFFIAFENLALYKADPSSFAVTDAPTFFNFFHLSFSGMFFQQVGELSPADDLSRILSMIGNLLTFTLMSLFLTLLFALKRDIDDSSVEAAVSSMEASAAEVGSYVAREFQLSIDGAISELEAIKSSSTGIINWLKKNAEGRGHVVEAVAK